MIFFSPDKLSIRTLIMIGEDYHIDRMEKELDEDYAIRVYKEILKDIKDYIDIINPKNWEVE